MQAKSNGRVLSLPPVFRRVVALLRDQVAQLEI